MNAKKLHDTMYVLGVLVLKQIGILVVSIFFHKFGFRQIPCQAVDTLYDHKLMPIFLYTVLPPPLQ
jgi:hypothetical protein